MANKKNIPNTENKLNNEDKNDLEFLDINNGSENTKDALDNEVAPEDIDEDFKSGKIFHILFLASVVIIIGVIVLAFLKWNRGVELVNDPDEDTSQYDTESADFILNVGESMLEGYEDDGITTVLFLGDDTFAQGKGTDSIPDLVAEELPDSVIINGAFNQTTMSTLEEAYDFDTCSDAFTPYWILNALVLQSYVIMDNAMTLDTLTIKDDDYAPTIEALKQVDLNDVDVIFLSYGYEDYIQDRVVTNVDDLSDIRTFSGAFQACVDLIQTNYPHIRILFSTTPINYAEDEDGNLVNTNLLRNDYNHLAGYYGSILATVLNCSYVSYVDNYYATVITEDTFDQYYTDNWHLNLSGRQVIADKLTSLLDGTYQKAD